MTAKTVFQFFTWVEKGSDKEKSGYEEVKKSGIFSDRYGIFSVIKWRQKWRHWSVLVRFYSPKSTILPVFINSNVSLGY
ncbi:hypothetical protein WDJ17_000718 [Vibrio cholerae]|uniref:hypothetical protein n=1 Tax=Vibrio cholerae TaxID=666 RepID=UPI00155E7804|nr:hypothetical protein [Vibrio cholerae]ELJ8791298.1 hypothetical protein [Vibrio cholerae]NOF40819.1 hypothetical protein [Vibrio cholerae]